MQQCDRLSVQEWKEMKAPWKDSVRMDCAMSGILLLMAQLLKKELEEKRIELEHVRGEREELQRQLDKANKDLEDLLKA